MATKSLLPCLWEPATDLCPPVHYVSLRCILTIHMPNVKYFDICIGQHVTYVGIWSKLHIKETFWRDFSLHLKFLCSFYRCYLCMKGEKFLQPEMVYWHWKIKGAFVVLLPSHIHFHLPSCLFPWSFPASVFLCIIFPICVTYSTCLILLALITHIVSKHTNYEDPH
jgi:hypothetical protein